MYQIIQQYKVYVQEIMDKKNSLYDFYPFKPYFYLVKLKFTGAYIIFLILLKT